MRILLVTAFISVSLLTAPLFVSNNFIGNFGDLHLHYYPLKHYISTRIVSGELPLWNPYIFCGTPCLANPQSGVFYPGSLIFYVFSNDTSFAFKIWLWLHLFFMLFGFFALIRRFIMDDTSSLAGALAVTFSSFVIYMVPAGHVVRLAGYAWFPLCGLLFIGMIENLSSVNKNGYIQSSVLKGKVFSIALCALAFSFAFLSGHPQGVFTTGFFAFAAVLAMALDGRVQVKNKIFAIGLALFAAMIFLFSLAQYLPSYEFSTLSEKAPWRGLAKTYSLKVEDFLSLFFPWRWGTPSFRADMGEDTLTTLRSIFFERKNLFLGYCAFTLAFLGIIFAIRDKLVASRSAGGKSVGENFIAISPEVLFGGVFAAGLLFSLGFSLPGYGFIYDKFPLVGHFRVPARFYFLSVVAIGYFVARAVYLLSRRRGIVIGIAAAAVIFLELFIWNKKFIGTMPLDYSHRIDLKISAHGDRIFTSHNIPANISMMNRFPNVNGYDALILKDFIRTFYSFYKPPQYRPATYLALGDNKEILTQDFPGWGLRYLITTADDELVGFNVAARSDRVVAYEKNFYSPNLFVPPRVEKLTHTGFVAFFPTKINPVTEAVYIRRVKGGVGYYNGLNLALKGYSEFFSSEKIIMEADVLSPGALVMGDVFYPGWRVWINGKESRLERASRVFRALNIDRTGDVKIHIAFMPFSVTLGIVVSVASAIFLITLLGFNLKYIFR